MKQLGRSFVKRAMLFVWVSVTRQKDTIPTMYWLPMYWVLSALMTRVLTVLSRLLTNTSKVKLPSHSFTLTGNLVQFLIQSSCATAIKVISAKLFSSPLTVPFNLSLSRNLTALWLKTLRAQSPALLWTPRPVKSLQWVQDPLTTLTDFGTMTKKFGRICPFRLSMNLVLPLKLSLPVQPSKRAS